MFSFAAAYPYDPHQSNEDRLNQLFGDIAGRPQIHQSTADSQHEGQSDLLDETGNLEHPELGSHSSSRAFRVPPRSSSIRSGQSSLGRLSPLSWYGSSIRTASRSRSRTDIRPTGSSLAEARVSPSTRRASSTARALSPGYSETSEVKSLEAFDARSDANPSIFEVLSPPTSPEPVAYRGGSGDGLRPHSQFTSVNAQGRLIPRSPFGRHSQLSRRSLSTIGSASTLTSQVKGDDQGVGHFPPHPGVRPKFEGWEKLGNACAPTDDDHEYPGPLPLSLIILGICLSVFIVSVNRNIVATAVPKITARFHSYQDIGWYGSAYLLTASAFQPLYGRVYMRFDTKSVYLIALAVFEVGSVICATSPSSDVLIVGRAVQGLGSAGILTGSFVVGTHSVRLQKRPILFAGVGMLFGVGALCGPILGGVLTDLATWRWCFYINLPVGAVTFVTVALCFKSRRHGSDAKTSFWSRLWQLDWIGNVLILGACTMLFLALEYSEEGYSWSSALVIGLIVGFGVTLIIFVGWMIWKGQDALIPVHIARQRTVAASCGAAFFIYGALLLQAYYLPIWFQAIKGDSAIQSGVSMVPYMVINAFFSLFAGVFVSKNGLFTPPAIVGCAIGTVGSGLLATLQPNSSTAKWAGYEVIVAAGLGMAIQQGFSAVQTALPMHEVPIGTAAVVACQSIGGAIFVSVGNTLLQSRLLNSNAASEVPGVNLRAVIALGATRFREVIPAEELPALIKLYNDALQQVLIAAVPLCGCAFLCSLCMEWRSVRKRGPTVTDEKA